MGLSQWVGVAVIIQAAATIVLVVVTAVYVKHTGKISEASQEAANENRRSSQAQLVLQLLQEYASPEMQKAIRIVRNWQGPSPHNAADAARRTIVHHFHGIARLAMAGLLDAALVRVVAKEDEVAFLCERIEPMERALNAEYDRATFDYLSDLYGGRAQLKGLVPPSEWEI